ncbi:MAG: recombinase RecT [Aestuariivirga sp.]
MNQIVKTEAEYGINVQGMPMGLAILFNDKLYDRVKQLAGVMAKAEGFTPKHLIGKSEACFAVITRAITWKLDPQAVAQSTYQTPNGNIGYEGKLVQAILENSGHIEGGVKYEMIGDWDKINGNFEIKDSAKGFKYPVPKWTREQAKAGGAGVIVSAQVKGEAEPRTLKFMLETCFPLNSTLWATRPDHQIKYTACRAFANTVTPGIFMGIPFSVDPELGDDMKDVTPRPRREDFASAEETKAIQDAVDDNRKTEETVNQTTGEVGEEETTEFGAPEAMELGRQTRRDGRPMKYPEWPGGTNDAYDEAFKQGFDETDAEIKAKLK